MFETEQEEFWSGEFGNDYIARNCSDTFLAANIALFSKIFKSTQNVGSILELGANIGWNLKAIHSLLPSAKMAGVEINKNAYEKLSELEYVEAIQDSILTVDIDKKYDLSLIKGVLIHLNPEALPTAYDLLYKTSNKYILVVEYYNPAPVTIKYRGHENKLFKRDFAGEMLERFDDLKLIDYGFAYHKDPNFPQDDLTWFLMEKN